MFFVLDLVLILALILALIVTLKLVLVGLNWRKIIQCWIN